MADKADIDPYSKDTRQRRVPIKDSRVQALHPLGVRRLAILGLFAVVFALVVHRLIVRKLLDDHPRTWPFYDVLEIGPPKPISLRPLANLVGGLIRSAISDQVKSTSIFVKLEGFVGEDAEGERLGFARFASRWRGRIATLAPSLSRMDLGDSCIASCSGIENLVVVNESNQFDYVYSLSDKVNQVTFWSGSWKQTPYVHEGDLCLESSPSLVLYLIRHQSRVSVNIVGASFCISRINLDSNFESRMFRISLPISNSTRRTFLARELPGIRIHEIFMTPSNLCSEVVPVENCFFESIALSNYLDCLCLSENVFIPAGGTSLENSQTLGGAFNLSIELVSRMSNRPLPIWTFSTPQQKSKRALVVWASSGHDSNLFPYTFQARTLGRWKDDIVLLTDIAESDMSHDMRASLKCLNIEVVSYTNAMVRRLIPFVEQNILYTKLLVLLMDEFREYEVIQYLDLDTIIVGEIVVFTPSDFDDDVQIFFEDNGGRDTSFSRRESITPRIKIDTLLQDFPGADSPTNGRNMSPSGISALIVALTSRLPSPVVLSLHFQKIVAKYGPVLDYADQPLLIMAFWGHWRVKHIGMEWRVQVEDVFRPRLLGISKELVRIIHSGGTMKPDALDSPYHPIFTMTMHLASTFLNCPSITAYHLADNLQP